MRRGLFRFLAALAVLGLALAACTAAPPGAGQQGPTSTPALEARVAPTLEGAPAAVTTREALLTAQAEAFSAGGPLPAIPPTMMPTRTPQPALQKESGTTPTARPPSTTRASGQQAAMREEVILAGPPVYAIMNRCAMPENAGGRAATWTESLDFGLLCLFGFGDGELVRYEVRDSTGALVVAGEATQDNMDGDPMPSVKVFFATAENAPGVWTARAVGTTDNISTQFEVQPLTQEGALAVVLVLSPAEGIGPGDDILITAYGLPPEAAATVGVYDIVSEDAIRSRLRLHEAAPLARTQERGAAVTLTLDPSYAPGDYCVVVAADATYEPVRELSALGATRCFSVE